MTPAEALREAANAHDEAVVCELIADLTEAARAEMMPVAREIVKAETKRGVDAVGTLGSTLLLAYGLLPVSDIRKLGWRSNHVPERLEDVLRRRSPERLEPIIFYLLDDFLAWAPVRALVREGVVPRPDRPSYTIAMLAATRYHPASTLLAEDPSLIDDEVWRLFEVEGGGEDSLANHDKYFGDSWGDTFRDLAAADASMRDRLLDASIAALGRDFSAYRAGWFSRFHESLSPTDEERAQRTVGYLQLLRGRVGATISMAMAALAAVERSGKLPSDALLDHVGPVLADGSAKAAKIGLGLVASVGARSDDGGRRAAIVATDALANASPDIQARALKLIGKLLSGPDDEVARALADRAPDVAASQRNAAAALLETLQVEQGAAASLPAVGEGKLQPPVTTASAHDTPPRRPSATDPDRRLALITSVEALVDVAVSVLETGEPADDVERVLHGVGRFDGRRSDETARLTAPVAKRARTILARQDSFALEGVDARADVAAVLLAWSTGELVESGWNVTGDGRAVVGPSRYGRARGAGVFLSARAWEIAAAVASGQPFHSIAVPTHAGGWIEPTTLVERAHAGPASRLDLVAAIFRLAPDGRDSALAAACDLEGEAGAVLRHALGGDERVGPTAAWWIAAARVRSPGGDDPLVEQRHPGLGPDAGMPARITFHVRDERPHYGGVGLEFTPAARDADSTVAELPSTLMLSGPPSMSWSGWPTAAMLRWVATIQPGYREPWAAVGCVRIARNIEWWSAEWPNRVFLEPFVDAVADLGPHARLLVGLALGSKEAGERGLASDIVRVALTDGRLTALSLSDALIAVAAVGSDRPMRWATALADVASESAGHGAAVTTAIVTCLAALEERPPAQLVPLLRLLDELVAGFGSLAAEHDRRSLERLSTRSGHTGRLARSILARG